MTCLVCRGSGALLDMIDRRPAFWACPACGGGGARIQYGPAEIDIHPWRERFAKNARKMELAHP